MNINHEETKNTKISFFLPSCSSFLRGFSEENNDEIIYPAYSSLPVNIRGRSESAGRKAQI
jgi:hypothetical protein